MKAWATSTHKQRQYALIAGDVAVFAASLALAIGVRVAMAEQGALAIANRIGVLPAGFLLLLYVVTFHVFDLYSLARGKTLRRYQLAMPLAIGAVLVLSVTLLFAFSPGEVVFGRTVLLVQAGAMWVGALLWRQAFLRRILPTLKPRTLALLGIGEKEAVLMEELRSAFSDLFEIRVLGPEDSSGSEIIVCPQTRDTPESILNRALEYRRSGARVTTLPNIYSAYQGRVPLAAIDAGWVLEHAAIDSGRVTERLRRVLDILSALVGLILASPIILVAGIIIKLTSRGPVFFSQERLGMSERPFRCYKLRTMIQEAEVASGPKWAEEDDPRITRIGRFLRKSRLDEVPQLCNVLRGEMALVGFRPIRQHFADQLAETVPFYRARFAIKPGLTGWPQVRHKNSYAGSVEDQAEKLEYELFYLQNRSLFLDAYIAIKTVQVMLFGRGQ